MSQKGRAFAAGAFRAMRARSRLAGIIPASEPGSARGATPLTNAAALTRPGRKRAQAAA